MYLFKYAIPWLILINLVREWVSKTCSLTEEKQLNIYIKHILRFSKTLVKYIKIIRNWTLVGLNQIFMNNNKLKENKSKTRG